MFQKIKICCIFQKTSVGKIIFMNNLLINTPQNVKIAYPLASLGARIIAFALDYALIILYLILIFSLLEKSGAFQSNDTWTIMGLYSLLALPGFFYPLVMESIFSGQTIGKKIMKIKVVKIDGTRATIYQYFIRWLLSIVDIWMSLGSLAITSIILSKDGQRLGDLAAETTIINLKTNLQIQDTLFEKIAVDPVITYPQVINLSDADANRIKEIFQTAYTRKDYDIILALAHKV